jgi:hypothetical protein
MINLDNYKNYQPTQSCYLDGRYFDLIFEGYPGLIQTQLYINLDMKEHLLEQETILDNFHYRDYDINIMRVIIETPASRHSGAIIFDMVKGELYYFDSSNHPDKMILLGIIQRLFSFPENTLVELPEHLGTEMTPTCRQSGFCVGYSIKFVYDYLMGRNFDPSQIRRFAAAIEVMFGRLNDRYEDVEYDTGSTVAGGALGGLGGLALAGPVGLLLGGIGGGIIGSKF